MMAWILQGRLQLLVEEELPESQCGFCKGCECSDMTFTLPKLLEKSLEHQSKQIIMFMDLKKAYDSVPRAVLWHSLENLGVPGDVINLVQSIHEGMKAWVSIGGELLEENIDVENGLRQGALWPVPFSICKPACLVMERWIEHV